MVTSSNLQPWARVDIVIKALDDPATSKTLQFTNRPANQGDATYLPLLKSYSGLSLEVGQDGLPSSGSGSIVISDQWESLGENRRVFDYFDRYTPINQTVTVYRSIETIGDLDMPSSWTAIYTGKVESYSKDKESITFSVSNTLLESKIAVRKIGADMAATGYEVPTQSLGKSLPLVFTDTAATIPAYSIDWSSTLGNAARYAFCTNLGDDFVVNPATAVCYCKDKDGDYVNIKTFGDASYMYGGNTGTGGYPTDQGKSEFIIPLDVRENRFGAAPNGIILTGVKWWCKGQNNGGITPIGKIAFSVYRSMSTVAASGTNISDWELIAKAEVAKVYYLASVRGATDFYVTCPFNEVVILGGDGIDITQTKYVYGVGFSITDYAGVNVDFQSGNADDDVTVWPYIYQTSTDRTFLLGTGMCPTIVLQTAQITAGLNPYIASTGVDGLDFSYLLVTPPNTTARCNELDMAVTIPTGILDDGYGSITGTPGNAIVYPHHVAKLLDYYWNGSSWAASNTLDTTTFSSLYSIFSSGSYTRKVTGFTEGEISWFDLLSTITKEMSCFLVPMTNGKLALWPWGNTGSVVRVFTDADIIEIGSFEETDPSTVINNIKIEYGKSFTQVFDQWEASGKAENLEGFVSINKSTSGYYSSLLANSETLYNKRVLEETGSQFIGDSSTATTRALYYALRHEHTHRTFTVTIPYFDNTDLKLMDIVDILSVHAPSYFGSTSKARLPTVTGIDVDPVKGEYFKQASRKRCQIIGLNNDYDGDFPKLVMTVREIKPRHKNDPTAANLG